MSNSANLSKAKATRLAGRVTKSEAPSCRTQGFIKWFADITIDDVPLVGGKNASLGEMYRELTSKGVKVPNGFAATAEAYRYFLREAGLDGKIRNILQGLDTRDMENLCQRGGRTCHAAIVSREPGMPAIVGAEYGTELLKDG